MLTTSSPKLRAAAVALACLASSASLAAPASASDLRDGTSNTIMFATSPAPVGPAAITRLMEEEGIGFDFRGREDKA